MNRNFLPLCVLVAWACDQKPRPAPSDDHPAPVLAPSATTAPPKPVELEPAIPTADVQATLDTWLAAQNEGNFERYSSLYADRFEGIKRVGPRTYRFDGAGWLADRARMFKKPMKVEARDVRTQSSARTAVIVFEQSWASGNFRDVGPKQLILTATDDGLRIAREEMLESHVGTTDDAPARAYDPGAFALVADGAVVLSTAVHRDWASGSPRLVARPTTAARDVDLTASGFGDWVGREMDLFGPAGQLCTGRIERIELLARVVPHFGTVAHWNGEEGAPRRDDDYVAAAIWQLAMETPIGHGVNLVGRLAVTATDPDAGEPGCADALWARPRGGTARPLVARAAQGADLEALVESFTDMPGYHAVQADYDAEAHRGAWHEDATALTSFTRFGTSWFAAGASAGYGCGGFEGAFWGIWSRSGLGGLVLQTDEEDPRPAYFAPRAAFELGEETFFVEPDRVLGRVEGRWGVVHETLPPNFDCGC